MTYAEIAKERDDLKSEIETLRAIMDKMLETGKALKAENTELKARLEKAVELPCKLGKNFAIKDYGFGRYRVEEVDIIGYNFDPYSPEIFPVDRYEHGYLSKEVFPTREAAEARLKELQGGKE